MTTQTTKFLLLIAALVFIGNAYSQTCPTGLVSYWKMDETTGLTLSDAKSGHNATSNLVLDRDNGIVRKSQIFDLTKHASINNHADYNFAVNSSFTIIYWMKFTEVSSNHVIFCKGDYKGGSPDQPFFCSGVTNSGNATFLLSDGTNFPQMQSSSSYNDGLWHQVACVMDNTADIMYLYVDGSVAASQATSFTGGFTNSSNIILGALLSNSNIVLNYEGSLDEVAIYNRALTSTEINTQKTAAINNGIGICDGEYPEITSVPIIKASINTAYSYTVQAIGKKSTMTYSLLQSPAGMTISSSTGLISWIPTTKNVDAQVKVRAANGIAPADTQAFRIYISDQVTCPTGLISLHKLNETAGPVYADQYVNHNATGSPSPTATTGKINGAQMFSSTTMVDIPDNADEFDWAKDASFSIEFWMKTSTTDEMTVLARYRTDAGAKWVVGTNSSGQANFELYDNSGNLANYTILSGTSVITNGNWHHVVAVRNGTNNTNKIYVDGVEENSVSKTYSNSFMADDPLPVTIGYTKRLVGHPEYHFLGSIDEVAIFNRALSAGDITSSYNSGNPTGYCAEDNFAPQFTSTPTTTVDENVAYIYNVTTEDIDGATVTIGVVNKPAWLNFTYTAGQKTAVLSGTPLSAHTGANNVSLRVVDSKNDTTFQSFTITVNNVNEPPVITTTPTLTANENALYTYTIIVTDVDAADPITISTVTLPSWLTFSYVPGAKTATISGTPDDANIGANAVELSVTDSYVPVAQQFTITVNAVNDLPVITAQSALSVSEDLSITLTKSNFTIVDPDNATGDHTLSVQSGTNYTFTGNTVTPALNFTGSLSVNVVANDLIGAGTVYQAIINVIAVNDPPVVTSTAILNAKIGSLYVYLFSADDVDNESLTLTAIALPDWLSFNAGNSILSGTPTIANLGQHLIIMRASDGAFNIDQAFTILVSTTAINEATDNEFVIYPVPVTDELNIRFKALTEETVVNIISVTGSIVKTINVPANTEIITIPVDNLKAGMYICHVKNSAFNSTSQLIISK